MSKRDWVLAEPAPAKWQAQFPEAPEVVRQLLWNREVRDKDDVERFLHSNYEKDLCDPFLFRDMERAVARIFKAIEKKEKIFVYGDYDADGVTGSVIIKSTLDALSAITDVYMPHREKEGYGLNSGAVEYIAKQGAKVVITNDCGISNAQEVDEARTKAIDVIVTDHHRIPEVVPKAYAILHPLIPGERYPNKFLTGGGVAFKLAQALIKQCSMFHVPCPIPDGFEKWLLDLVAISTVADVGKLLGENRTLVKYGLIVMNKTRRVGLQKLIEVARLKAGALGTWNIAWQIAPRINAAGRMDHANTAFKLLITEDAAEAQGLAQELNAANVARQKATEQAVAEAWEQIHNAPQPPLNLRGGAGELPYLLAAYSPAWSAGIIGLVAGRLMDEFQKPVLIGTRNENGKIVASARSIEGFNIVEALAVSREFLEKFGGHPKAAGFSVADEAQWRKLVEHLQKLAHEKLHEVDIRPSLQIDADVMLNQVDWDLVGALQALAPFGEGNPEPRFLIHGVRVVRFDKVGSNGAHLRVTVADEEGKAHKMIGFRCGDWCERLAAGDLIDVVVEIGVNEWNGNREIELKITDLRFHPVTTRRP